MYTTNSKRATLLAFALAIGLAGCASTGGTGESGPRSTPNRLVAADMQGLEQMDALQVIQRLRPRWLQTRSGDSPVVYVDGARRGSGLGDLRGLRSADIQQMEYMSANDASTRFGTGHTGGAIMVTTRR